MQNRDQTSNSRAWTGLIRKRTDLGVTKTIIWYKWIYRSPVWIINDSNVSWFRKHPFLKAEWSYQPITMRTGVSCFVLFRVNEQLHGYSSGSYGDVCEIIRILTSLIDVMYILIFHHDDVIKWNIFALLALCVGNSPVTGEFPSQRPVTRSFDVFFDLCLNQQMSKLYGDAGDLRRHRAHYDVTVMWSIHPHCMNTALIQCQSVGEKTPIEGHG